MHVENSSTAVNMHIDITVNMTYYTNSNSIVLSVIN